MRCQQFESRLNAVLDERRDPASDLQLCAHARSCPSCRGLLETHLGILSACRERKEVIATWHPTKSVHRSAEQRARDRAIALAGLLATACTLVLLLSNWPTALRSDRSTAERSALLAPLPAITLDSSPRLVEHTLPDSTPPTATAETPNVAWGELRQLNLEWLFPDLELPRQQGSEWLSRVRQVGGSLRPLTNSVTSTFSILRRTWPGTTVTESTRPDQAHLPLESDQLA